MQASSQMPPSAVSTATATAAAAGPPVQPVGAPGFYAPQQQQQQPLIQQPTVVMQQQPLAPAPAPNNAMMMQQQQQQQQPGISASSHRLRMGSTSSTTPSNSLSGIAASTLQPQVTYTSSSSSSMQAGGGAQAGGGGGGQNQQLQHQQYQMQQQQQQQLQQQQHQQPQQQQQMQFTHQGLNGGWQSDKDYQERRKMIAKIVHLLQQRKPNAPQEWLKKLPQMAKRLEESLYRSAKNFDEYNDASTLKNRLQQLAVNIGMKTKKLQQQAMLQQQQQQQGLAPPNAMSANQQMGMRQPSVTAPAVGAPVQQQQQHVVQQPQPLAPQPVQVQQPQQQQRMVNMADINPLISNQSRIQQQQQPLPPSQPQQQSQPQHLAPAPQQQPSSAPVQSVQFHSSQQPQQAPAPLASSGAATAQAPMNGAQQQKQMNDRQQVLRHQQQRLLLLRHAAKCQHEDGRCPVTPHCAGMKRLWKHIAECKNQKCLVPHCVSSRYVLSHYHRCKDVRCPVCGPVREAIHRSHEKQKQMQALKQRHQQAVQQQQQQQFQQSGPAGVAGVSPQPGSLVQPGAVSSASVGIPGGPGLVPAEPPQKRQRTSLGLQHPPPFQAPQRPLQHPTAVRSGSLTSIGSSVQMVPQPLYPQAVDSAASSGGIAPRAQVAAVPGLAFTNGQVMMQKEAGPKPQENHTLINCFSVEQIETHIASLNKGLQLPPLKLKTKCLDVLKVLQSHQHGWVFNSPVDPVELGLPDYFEVIKKPMDLGTIRKKLENGVYHTLEEFEGNVHLTFDNAMLYNPEGSVVYNMAKEMKDKFRHDYAKLIHQLNIEEDEKRKNGEACLLCGCEKLLFEPPVFYCNGHNCASKRIRRNSYYYVAGNNQYHWCHQCYQELKDNSSLDLGEVTVKKETLTKKKNDETHEESWVQCDRCERWVHQICALFNTRQNKDQRSEYACPKCTIKERKEKGQLEATSSTPMAEDLPRTILSEYLENHVRVKVNEFIAKKAQTTSTTEGITIEDATKKVQMGGPITIRQVTSMDRKLEVRERMKARYAFKNYPEEFSFRCKCIVVFQNLDGVDVMLFGLYVYEHNDKNPPPNKRAVYISYLDSVHYMRPRQMRTFIYHEILISYLDYVRRRGFSTAHIWACPPLKGDDYILYAKPEDQKTPKDDRLRQWYIDMLIESQRRGIVGKLTNMYDLYFSDPRNDATVVPYMDGDYFPAEVENIIKDIEEGKSGKKSNVQGKKKDKQKQKKKSGRGGTRSTGLDEDALRASGILPPGIDQKSLEDGGRDYVMTKLGEIIQPMKESFIVAFLSWIGAKEEDMVVPKDIQEYREKHGITWELKESDLIDSDSNSTPSTSGEEVPPANTVTESPSSHTDVASSSADGKSSSAEHAIPPEAKSSSSTSPEETLPSADARTDEAPPQGASSLSDAAQPETPAGPAPDSSPPADPTTPADPIPPADPSAPSNPIEQEVAEPMEGVESSDVASAAEPNSAPTTAAPTNSDDGTVSTNSNDGTAPVNSDDGTAPSKSDTGTAPAKSDTGTAPVKSDAGTAPTNSDAGIAPTNSDAGPAPMDSDAGTAPTNSDAGTAPTNSDAGTAPMDADAVTDAATTAGAASAPEPSNAAPAAPTGTSNEVAKAPAAETAASTSPTAAATSPTAETSTETPASTEPVADDPKPAVPNLAIREGKFAAMQARKRDLEGNNKPADSEEAEKEKPEKEPKSITVMDSKGRMVKVLDDDEEELDCEFLNNRQAFLNLCQGNHYQFDQLRRAKHSSMMVLWHLHNRDAPKFVQQCTTCSREILTGYRFHCSTCADFDQCQECYQNPAIQRHPHPLKPIPLGSGSKSELSAAQRAERQRSIQLHMTLLLHAATCSNPRCPSANCNKMKGLMKHGAQCTIKAAGGCNVCKRIWALLQIHARQCKAVNCPVPNCMAIRERFRQLKKQQQAMDDRRRQEMNRAYRGKR